MSLYRQSSHVAPICCVAPPIVGRNIRRSETAVRLVRLNSPGMSDYGDGDEYEYGSDYGSEIEYPNEDDGGDDGGGGDGPV